MGARMRWLQLAILPLVLSSNVLEAKSTTIDFERSKNKVEFKAKGKPSLIVISGEAEGIAGKFTLEGGKVGGEVSVDLRTLQTGIPARDKHMREKYLQVDKYPTAAFVPTKLPWKSVSSANDLIAKQAPFEGEMSLHGVKKPIKGTITTKKKDDSHVDFDVRFNLKMSDFAIEAPKFAEITVGDNVDVGVLGVAAVTSTGNGRSP